MKQKFLKLILALSLGAIATVASLAQEAVISPAKKALIAELIRVTKADTQMQDSMRAMYGQMDAAYPKIISETLAADPSLTPREKKALEASIAKADSSRVRLQDRIVSELDFRQVVEDITYPLYDKHFSEAELADLLQFYSSPTGQKIISSMPSLMADSIKLTLDSVLPKITEIVRKTATEDIAEARKTLPKRPRKG